MRSLDELILWHCCELAWEHQSLALPNPSVCAIVVSANGEILGTGVHIIAGSPHAEVLAIQKAYYALTKDEQILSCQSSESIHQYLLASHQNLFTQCSLYVSLEPCNHQGKTPPCATLIAHLKFAKVCIAISESHTLATGGLSYLLSQKINAFILPSPKIAHYAKSLLLPFDTLRTKGRFVLFKLAQRLDGSYKDGRISSQDSQNFTHNQRSVCNYICISGATLRADNPQLNARYATYPYNNTATPQVLVFSRTLRALPTPNPAIHNRVQFCENTHILRELQGFVIVEGGFAFLHNIREEIDMFLLLESPHCIQNEENHLGFDECFSLLHQAHIGKDIVLWLK